MYYYFNNNTKNFIAEHVVNRKNKTFNINWNVIQKQICTDGQKGSYLIDFLSLLMAVL